MKAASRRERPPERDDVGSPVVVDFAEVQAALNRARCKDTAPADAKTTVEWAKAWKTSKARAGKAIRVLVAEGLAEEAGVRFMPKNGGGGLYPVPAYRVHMGRGR